MRLRFDFADDAEEAAPPPRERRLADILRTHEVPEPLLWRIAETAGADARDELPALAAALEEHLAFAPWSTLRRTQPILLAGPPGSGKTVLAAKIAARLARSRPVLVNTDIERAASTAQLAEYADVLGVTLTTAATVDGVRAALLARPAAPAIVDTAGIDSRDTRDVARLAKLVAGIGAAAFLVLPANIEPEEGAAVARAFAACGIRRLVATRLDMTRRLGGIIEAAFVSRMAIAGASVSPHFAYGLRPLTPAALARRLVSAALDERRWPDSAMARIERVA